MNQLAFDQISLKINFELQFKGLSQAETDRKSLTNCMETLIGGRSELTCSIQDVLCQDRTLLLPLGLLIHFSSLRELRIER